MLVKGATAGAILPHSFYESESGEFVIISFIVSGIPLPGLTAIDTEKA